MSNKQSPTVRHFIIGEILCPALVRVKRGLSQKADDPWAVPSDVPLIVHGHTLMLSDLSVMKAPLQKWLDCRTRRRLALRGG